MGENTAALPTTNERRPRLFIALGIYLICTAVFLIFAAPERLSQHTPFNHFALLANSWLEGRLDLGARPPAYTQMNDFAQFEGKWYVTFPFFPAVLLVPAVWIGKSAEAVPDGLIFICLAGVAPAALFLALEKLRRLALSERSVRENACLGLLFAFGTVYFFSAEQGTVWFSAHIVGAGLIALYALFALGAERPLLAGLMLGLGFLTRSPLIFAFPLFLFEALRVSSRGPSSDTSLTQDAASSSRLEPIRAVWQALDKPAFLKRCLWFALPVCGLVALSLWHNYARFGSPGEFGYRFLTVRWAQRMETWGLFHYHYLGRNLGVVLSGLPYWAKGQGVPFQINGHGLALWFTTPMYLWLLWPKQLVRRGARALHLSLWITAACVAFWTLLYQNTGWVQFGQRFSNDYAIFLFLLLAVGARRFGWKFRVACVAAVLINAFGALSFDRADYRAYYVIRAGEYYQPD